MLEWIPRRSGGTWSRRCFQCTAVFDSLIAGPCIEIQHKPSRSHGTPSGPVNAPADATLWEVVSHQNIAPPFSHGQSVNVYAHRVGQGSWLMNNTIKEVSS